MEAKPERLQKILAAAGLASRRKAEEMIAAGLVSVNGQTVTEPGSKADPRLDEIRVEGKLLRGPERHVYLAIYKPKGVMTTVSDPEGRPTVMDLLKGVEERVFPVGRLDYMSEGLLLLTNDGELMERLTRAGSHVAKSYMVKVSGKPSEEAIEKLRNGILLPPEPGLTGARGKKQPGVERRSFAVLTRPAEIQLAVDQENPWFEVTLTEGRNRQLRRMFEQIGHHIEKIKRIRYGSLTLDLEPGEFRYLTPKEVSQLRRSIEAPFKPKSAERKGPPSEAARPKGKHGEERREAIPRSSLSEAARFVKGRRGKPVGEAAAAAERRTVAGRTASAGGGRDGRRKAFGAGTARRQFTSRPERGAARSFEPAGAERPRAERPRAERPRAERPRGPEFAREGRQERYAGRGATSRGEDRYGERRTRREGAFAGREESQRDERAAKRPAPRGEGFGFQKFAKPEFAKPGFGKPGFAKPGFGKPGFAKSGFAKSKSGGSKFGTPGVGKFAKPGSGEPELAKSGAGSGRKYSKGPGKPAGGGRAGKALPRGGKFGTAGAEIKRGGPGANRRPAGRSPQGARRTGGPSRPRGGRE